MQFDGVQSVLVPAYWSHVEPLITRAIDVENDHTIEEVYQSLIECGRQLWVAGDDEINAILITSQSNNVCYVELCAGEGGISCIEHLATVEAWAKDGGCHRIEVLGRKGWERALKEHGYGFKNITLKKDLA